MNKPPGRDTKIFWGSKPTGKRITFFTGDSCVGTKEPKLEPIAACLHKKECLSVAPIDMGNGQFCYPNGNGLEDDLANRVTG